MMRPTRDWDELWNVVGEGLLGGLHHALNNRVAALGAIAQVLASGMPDAAPLLASLSSEVARLEETVAMLAHLRRSRAARAEPIQLPELVKGVVPLLAQHGELKEIEFVAGGDPGVLPVLAERDLLTRVLLVLMVTLGVEAGRAGSGRVLLSYEGDEDTVALRLESRPSAGEVRHFDRSGPRLDARAAAPVAAVLGGELLSSTTEEGTTTCELRLPTLTRARRQAAGAR